jgi:hypothetical protein
VRRLAPPVALLLALLAPERGEANAAFAFYGTTNTGKTFNRPTEDRTALTGKVVGYGVQPFFVDADATCTLYSVQEFANGLIYLYEGAFDPSAPLQNLVAADDDADLGAGTSAVFGVPLDRNKSYYLVTSATDPGGGGSFSTFVACAGAARVLAGDGSMPAYDGRYSELGKGRFRISATWKDFQGGTGVGRFVPLGSEDSGVIWFFSPSNFEVMIKVLDACSFNNRYWVFFAAVTSVEFVITVEDTFTDTSRTYSNALGVSAPAVTDTNAFQTCP